MTFCQLPYCNNGASFRGYGPDGMPIYVCGLHSTADDTRLER